MAIATSTAMLIAAGVAAATTAVTVSQAHQAGKAQKSAAEAAARTQEEQFNRQLAAFETSQDSLMSQIPDPEAVKDEAREAALRRRRLAAQTILTSPVGIIGEPRIARKTLLGQ